MERPPEDDRQAEGVEACQEGLLLLVRRGEEKEQNLNWASIPLLQRWLRADQSDLSCKCDTMQVTKYERTMTNICRQEPEGCRPLGR